MKGKHLERSLLSRPTVRIPSAEIDTGAVYILFYRAKFSSLAHEARISLQLLPGVTASVNSLTALTTSGPALHNTLLQRCRDLAPVCIQEVIEGHAIYCPSAVGHAVHLALEILLSCFSNRCMRRLE